MNVFCKGPDSKYFGLCKAVRMLLPLLDSARVTRKQTETIHKPMSIAVVQ